MIYVTRLNHSSVVLNSDLIEHIDTTPDTVISLTTGQKLMVLESTDEIIHRVIQYRRSILTPVNGDEQPPGQPRDASDEMLGNQTHGRR
jgi:flagellar protein FlbD